jgi:hypothetical protein
MMKKIRILGIALFALFAFGAIVSSAAFAEGEWLVENKSITAAEGALRAETEGSVLLVNYSEPGLLHVLNEVLCSRIFVGTIGPGAAGSVTEVLDLAQKLVGTDGSTLTGTALLCDVTLEEGSLVDCKTGTGEAELWVANLPWTTTLELVAGAVLNKFVGSATGEPGYEVSCLSLLGVKGENLCVAPSATSTFTLMSNEPAGTPASVLGFFDAFGAGEDSELGNCSLTGEHTAEVVSDEGISGDTWAAPTELVRLATAITE